MPALFSQGPLYPVFSVLNLDTQSLESVKVSGILLDNGLCNCSNESLELFVVGCEISLDIYFNNSADTADALSAYGVKYYGCSLLLRSKTTLRFYFEKTDASKFDAANFKIDGNTVEVNNYGDGSRYVYIEVTNIAAPDLAATHKVAVGNVEIGNVSPLNYAKDVLSDADASADLKNVMTALYRFYEAADKRF